MSSSLGLRSSVSSRSDGVNASIASTCCRHACVDRPIIATDVREPSATPTIRIQTPHVAGRAGRVRRSRHCDGWCRCNDSCAHRRSLATAGDRLIALDSRRASLDDARVALGETEELVAARAVAAERLDACSARPQSRRKTSSCEADDLKAKIAPHEAEALQRRDQEPEGTRPISRRTSISSSVTSRPIEDRDLEALAALEAAQSETRVPPQAELRRWKAAWREEQAELTARIDGLAAEIAELEAERA